MTMGQWESPVLSVLRSGSETAGQKKLAWGECTPASGGGSNDPDFCNPQGEDENLGPS